MLFSKIILSSAILVAIIYIVKIIFDYVVRIYYLHKVPGPPLTEGNIIYGNIEFHNKNRVQIFATLREWGSRFYPLYCLWMFHLASVNLLSPEDFEIVLSSIKHEKKNLFYTVLSRWLKTGLLTSEGSKWQFRRKMLTPAFHFNILQGFVDVFNEETDSLVALLQNEVEKPIDVVPLVSQFTLKAVGQTAMGTKFDFLTKKQINYRSAIYRIVDLYIHRMFRPWMLYDFLYMFTPSCFEERKLVKTLHNFTTEVIQKRETEFKEIDGSNNRKRLVMLDLLLSAKAEGTIDYEGIREEVDTFMFEGHDTTAVAISFALMLIASHPKVQKEILEEMRHVFGDIKKKPSFADLQELRYLERCVKETLRLFPSVFIIGRILGEDIVTHSGYKIKKDSLVQLHIYDLHHNPEVFPDPEKFDPDRFLPENIQKRHPFAFVPFSAGPRNCIGQRFAILELKSVISAILANFVLEPVDTQETVVLAAGIVIRAKNGVKVKFVPRND